MRRRIRPPTLRIRTHSPLRSLFQLLWELPQTLLGLLVFLVMRSRGRIRAVRPFGGRRLLQTPDTGVSLGFFVFWSGTRRIREHELGHALQSVWLGPAYLVAVGLPSIVRAAFAWLYSRRHGREWGRYFDGYPENWADRLGGVRNERKA